MAQKKIIIILIILSILLTPSLKHFILAQGDFFDFDTPATEEENALQYLDWDIQMKGRIPSIIISNIPEGCFDKSFTAKIFIDGTQKLRQTDLLVRDLLVRNKDKHTITFISSVFPSKYKQGKIEVSITPKTDECKLIQTAKIFQQETPSQVSSILYTPLSGIQVPQGPKVQNIIENMALSIAMSTVMGLITKNVPVGDEGVVRAAAKNFATEFKGQISQIKMDLNKMLNESGEYIMQQIFNMTLQKMTQSVEKLQIKNPENYKTLNATAGLIAGIAAYSQRGCVDPAVINCVTASVKNILTAEGKMLDSKNAQKLQREQEKLIRQFKPCARSRIKEETRTTASGKPRLVSLFNKIPFFADVLQSKNYLAQTSGLSGIANESSAQINPISSFVTQGQNANLTAIMCQNAVAELVSMASSEASRRAAEAMENIKTGFMPLEECVDPVGADPNSISCKEKGTLTSPGRLSAIADWVSTAEGNSILAKLGDPEKTKLNVVTRAFGNWFDLKVSSILNKGFGAAAEKTPSQNTALGDLGKRQNIKKACADIAKTAGGGLGQELVRACEETYLAQMAAGAQFDERQIQENLARAREVSVDLSNLVLKFQELTAPDKFSEKINSSKDFLTTDIIERYNQLSTNYTDLNSKLSALLDNFKQIVPGIDIQQSLADLNKVSDPNDPATQQVNKISDEITVLQSAIDKNLKTYQNKIQSMQGFAGSRLFGLFYEQPKVAKNYPAGEIKNYTFYKKFDTGSISQFLAADLSTKYKDTGGLHLTIDGITSGTAKGYFQIDLIYFLSQDLAPSANNLENTSGFILSAINYLSEIFSGERILSEKEIAEISELDNYFASKKSAYEKLQDYAKSKGWTSEDIQIASQSLSIESVLEQVIQITSTLTELLTSIQQDNILANLQQIGVKQTELERITGSQQGKINTAYEKLADAILLKGSNFFATEKQIDDIESEISDLNLDVNLYRSNIDSFAIDIDNEIKNIPPAQTPTEELPQVKTSEKPKIGFLQKTLGIVKAPFNLMKTLLGNITKLIESKRVKLK